MNIYGSNIFMGAYEERRKSHQYNPSDISEKQKILAVQQIEAAIEKKVNQKGEGDAASLSISKKDMDFLCSEEGFRKMKEDTEDLYITNANQQKQIAAGRDKNDPFWENTGNQWMVFSEYLYNSGYYDNIEDSEVRDIEGLLGKITAGMDHISRNQYNTGINFSDYYGNGSNFFMSSNEVLMELESSSKALNLFAEKYVPYDKREQFNELVESYSSHNSKVLEEYHSPYESMQKAIYSINTGYYPDSAVLSEKSLNRKPSEEYKYTMLLGGITKTSSEKKHFQEDIAYFFEKMGQQDNNEESLWTQLENKYANYTTNDSDDGHFRNFMLNQSKDTFNRIKSYWFDLQK